jgi:ribonucleases P/MRP protein subunit RPP40
VAHIRLLHKLKSMGIQSLALKWIEDFVTGRSFSVRVGEKCSEERAVLSGVPQGSVLGPLLFLAFVADLPGLASEGSRIRMFADDTKIYRNIRSVADEDALQNDLNEIYSWCDKWLLDLNVKKCKSMRIGPHSGVRSYELGEGETLDCVMSERDLGVIIDSDLKFSEHIHNKINIAKRNIYMIRQNFRYLDAKTVMILYKSLVRPHLEFCSPVWNPSQKALVDSLERVQRAATRLVPEVRGLAYERRLEVFGLQSLSSRRSREDIIALFLLNRIDHLRCLIPFKDAHGTRGHALSLFKERCQSREKRNFLFNRALPVWNSFPDGFSEIGSLNALKNFLRANLSPEQ